MKIRIKGKEYNFEVNSVWRPMYMFETITKGKMQFDDKSVTHMHILFYCIVLLSNEGCDLDFDDFIDGLDDVAMLDEMVQYYKRRMEYLSSGQFKIVDEDATSDKKKV